MAKRITTMIEHLLNSEKAPNKGERYKEVEADSPKLQASRDATSSDPKEAKNKNSECNSAADVPEMALIRGERYRDEEADSSKHKASQDATNSDPKEAKSKVSECNSATDVLDSSTVQDTVQKLTFKRLQTFSNSNKEPKSGDAETEASSNNPGETKNECSEYINSTGIKDTNATDKANNQTSSTYHRRNYTAQRNPDFLWIDSGTTFVHIIY
jgi:hypothetical protein